MYGFVPLLFWGLDLIMSKPSLNTQYRKRSQILKGKQSPVHGLRYAVFILKQVNVIPEAPQSW